MARLRIVDVCAYFVHNPSSGGQARVFGFNQALSLSGHAIVEQFSFTPVMMTRKTFVYSRGYEERINPDLLYTAGVVLLKLFGIKNYDFIIPYAFRFARTPGGLKQALKEADLVQVEHPWLLSWVAKKTGKPIVYVAHNVEYDLNKDLFKKTLFGALFRDGILKSLKKTEGEAVKQASMIFAMSEEDKERLSALYHVSRDKIFVVPNGADYPKDAGDTENARNAEDARNKNKGDAKGHERLSGRLSREDAKRKLGFSPGQKIALFTGSNHPPNHEAARFIGETLAPKLRSITFVIMGGVCKPKGHDDDRHDRLDYELSSTRSNRRNWRNRQDNVAPINFTNSISSNVIRTGFVPESTKELYLRAADIAINPVVSGSGSNLKMFAYLANGLPVVATPKGIRGVDAKQGKDLLVSDLDGFPKVIATLIKDRRLQTRLSRNGMRVAKGYDWGVIARKAMDHYQKLL